MTTARLAAHVEVAGLLKRAQAQGGFGTVLKKGEATSGSILITVTSRGDHMACLERVLSIDGSYTWRTVGPPESAGSMEIGKFLASRARFDEDAWIIELDIVDAERFIAETKLMG